MRVAVVGGGLAGLSAAYDLARAGVTVTLVDDGPRPGGQVRTRREQGFIIEDGAEGWVTGNEIVRGLCRDLGITDQIIPQLATTALLLKDGRLAELSSRDAAALLGIPTPKDSEPQGIESLKTGTGALAEALARALPGQVRRGRAVKLVRSAGWSVHCEDGTILDAEGLILAVPPAAAAELLAPLASGVRVLGRITHHNNLSVTLGYRREQIAHSLAASGIVVGDDPAKVGGLRACAFSSSKFADRAPAAMVLVRAFYRPPDDQLELSDQHWISNSVNVLEPVVGISGRPVGSWVGRWRQAIPQYGPDHAATVEEFRTRLQALDMIEVTGAAFVPGGIPGAIRGGRAAARNLSPTPLPT